MTVTAPAFPAVTKTDRLLSLDIARGITIAFMIMVNSELLSSTLGWIHIGDDSLEHWIYSHSFSYIQPAGVGSLLYSICFAFVCWLVTYELWRRRIFLKI